MSAYIVIKTLFDTYKCHDYRIKNGRVYYNSRAINLANVVSITLKDETIAYKNDALVAEKPKRVIPHHYSSLKGAEKCKATIHPEASQKWDAKTPKMGCKKSSSLPDVIEI